MKFPPIAISGAACFLLAVCALCAQEPGSYQEPASPLRQNSIAAGNHPVRQQPRPDKPLSEQARVGNPHGYTGSEFDYAAEFLSPQSSDVTQSSTAPVEMIAPESNSYNNRGVATHNQNFDHNKGHQKIVNPTMHQLGDDPDPVQLLHRNIEKVVPNSNEDHVFYNLPATDQQPGTLNNLHGYVRGFQEPLPVPDDVHQPWAVQTSAAMATNVDAAASEFEDMFASAYTAPDPGRVDENSIPSILASDDTLLTRDSGFELLQSEPDLPEVEAPSGVPEFGSQEPEVAPRDDEDALMTEYDLNKPVEPRAGYPSIEMEPEDQYPINFARTEIDNIRLDDAGELLWWKPLVLEPLHDTNRTQPAEPNALVYETLRNSPRIGAISKNPLLRELQIAEARADFDPVHFLRTQWDDRNDPVGNELTTGNGELFLRDNIWSATGGRRRKLAGGGNVEVSQNVGFQNSNSRFFQPQDQGTATLALNFSQPLMKGRGRFYNTSQILIAQTATGAEWETFRTELQDELKNVVDGYWQLYYERSVFLQKKRNVIRGTAILELLEGRLELDSLPNQIARARSSVLSRKTSLANALRDVRNAETELQRLMADPNWMANQSVEMVPQEPAMRSDFSMPLDDVIYTAMENRNEIKESFRRAKIAAIQHDVSENELLPDLSLLLNTYVSALEGDSGIERALQSQLTNGPGYSVGFEFEMPMYNRAARSRLAQRKVQMSKIKHEINEVMQNVVAENKVAHRRLLSAYQTMDAALVAIQAARADLEQNHRRWQSFALIEGDLADGQSPTTVLDQLLDSQDRLASAELVYASSELELKLSEIGLRRAMGTLLKHEQVRFRRHNSGDVPNLTIDRAQGIPVQYNSNLRYPIDAPNGDPVSASYNEMNFEADGQAPIETQGQLVNPGTAFPPETQLPPDSGVFQGTAPDQPMVPPQPSGGEFLSPAVPSEPGIAPPVAPQDSSGAFQGVGV